MQQAWHIFKKDVLYLRREIVLYLAMLGAAWEVAYYNFGYSLFIADRVMIAIGAYLVSRLIHADAPAGNRQFWITRPYRWTSLLGAKLLFIVVFVCLPELFAQWAVVVHEAYRFSAVWKGLFFEQFLLLCGVYLPLAALAAVTTGLVPFVAWGLVAVVVNIAVKGYGVHLLGYPLGPFYWVRSSLDFVTILTASTVALGLQYHRRRTARNSLIAVGVLSIGAIACILMPWSTAFAVQQGLSTQPVDASALRFRLDAPPGGNWGLAMAREKRVQIEFQLQVEGLPPGTEGKPEALDLTLQAPDGRDIRLQQADIGVPGNSGGLSSSLNVTVKSELDRDFFEGERDRPLTLRGTFYLTVFGNRKTTTIPAHWTDRRVAITDTLRCIVGEYGIICDSPFRWPNQRIRMSTLLTTHLSSSYPMSYSPFPADLRFYPFVQGWEPMPVQGAGRERQGDSQVPDVTVEVAEPVAYLRRDFEIRDVRLPDIAVPWQSHRVTRNGKTFFENQY